jgi:hypothetical protein
MVWMPPPDGIAMCQDGDAEVTIERGGILSLLMKIRLRRSRVRAM